MTNPPKAFISHAHEDKERFVDNFASLLRQHGIDAWYDNWEIGPGDSLVKKIFDDILQLPFFTGTYNCPMELANSPIYTLSFYKSNKLTDTAVKTTTGCRTVTIDNYTARLDTGFSSFDTDFQKATGL